MKPSILIIDDDAAILDALEIFLSHEGYRVTTIRQYNGYFDDTDAQDLPDLIILDILLLNEDGRKIATRLKASAATKHIPIVMISAHQGAEELALAAGADVFIAKPFDMNQILGTLEKLLTPKP